MVLFPEPLSPVSHSVAPFCPSSWFRSSRVACPSCQVMLVALITVIAPSLLRAYPDKGTGLLLLCDFRSPVPLSGYALNREKEKVKGKRHRVAPSAFFLLPGS